MGDSTIPDPAPPPDWGEPRGARMALRELVDRTGVPPASIHHYRRLGLLPEPTRVASNRFSYDQRHVEALTVLRLLRERRNLSLERIRDVLPALLADHEDQAFRAEMWQDAVDSLLLDPAVSPDVGSKLVDVAVEAFAETGYSEVSVADLCDRAGIAKGSFYRHFDTKDDLFLAAAHTVVDRAAVGFAERLAREPLEESQRGEALAELLRPGLPLLLELAKRSVQERGGHGRAAQEVFGDLAERLGLAVRPGDDADVVGGALIMDAVVRIFSATVMDEPDAPR